MTRQRYDITPVCEADDLVMWRHEGRNDKLVVCFSGVAKSKDVVPPYEFPRGATENVTRVSFASTELLPGNVRLEMN